MDDSNQMMMLFLAILVMFGALHLSGHQTGPRPITMSPSSTRAVS